MHYSRAAQRLNISQSGLSHAIAALEQELGVSLFQKSGRGIALGRYGAALLSQAQQIVALADSCLRHFQMLREGVGTLRLQTIPLLIIPTVTRLCRQFKQANPGCDFEFSTGMSSQVCQSVIQARRTSASAPKSSPIPSWSTRPSSAGPWWPPSLWTTLWPARTP